jgi:hypothetical protein
MRRRHAIRAAPTIAPPSAPATTGIRRPGRSRTIAPTNTTTTIVAPIPPRTRIRSIRISASGSSLLTLDSLYLPVDHQRLDGFVTETEPVEPTIWPEQNAGSSAQRETAHPQHSRAIQFVCQRPQLAGERFFLPIVKLF